MKLGRSMTTILLTLMFMAIAAERVRANEIKLPRTQVTQGPLEGKQERTDQKGGDKRAKKDVKPDGENGPVKESTSSDTKPSGAVGVFRDNLLVFGPLMIGIIVGVVIGVRARNKAR